MITGEKFDRVVQHVIELHDGGMTWVHMEKLTGLPYSSIKGLRDQKGAKVSTLAPLARLQAVEPLPHTWVPSHGARRRLGALWADGFSLPYLASRLDFGTRGYLQSFLRGQRGGTGIEYRHVQQITWLYEELAGMDPEKVGIEQRKKRMARTFARKKGFAPSRVWDWDTLDDPHAIPQWTGQCGTPFGARIHRREQIPMCGPCAELDTGAKLETFSKEKFRALRERRGFSRKALADRVGMNESSIVFWEQGRSVPARENKIDAILSVLDATFEDVCYEEEQ